MGEFSIPLTWVSSSGDITIRYLVSSSLSVASESSTSSFCSAVVSVFSPKMTKIYCFKKAQRNHIQQSITKSRNIDTMNIIYASFMWYFSFTFLWLWELTKIQKFFNMECYKIELEILLIEGNHKYLIQVGSIVTF